MAGQDWTKTEVELIVKDYFEMLHFELCQQKFNKTRHRSALLPLLDDRSEGSIESKHRNISAILIKYEKPYINGYKPLPHIQGLLEEEVVKYLEVNKDYLEHDFYRFVESDIQKPPKHIDFTKFLNTENIVSALEEEKTPSFNPIKQNYLALEQENRKQGEIGESIVMEYEKWRLTKLGKDHLATKIEWISKEKGDGAGYDILSKNDDGTDRYIEVKTTKLSKENPIFFTKNELRFASLNAKDFYLYRVFNLHKRPQLFIKNGTYENYCKMIPQTFKGFFF